jgi:hypothetical protein
VICGEKVRKSWRNHRSIDLESLFRDRKHSVTIVAGRSVNHESGSGMKIISYVALIFASGFLIIVYDKDPSSVQPFEWVCMVVMLAAAFALIRILVQAARNQHW